MDLSCFHVKFSDFGLDFAEIGVKSGRH